MPDTIHRLLLRLLRLPGLAPGLSILPSRSTGSYLSYLLAYPLACACCCS
jgi:hypothetical protein